MVKNFQMSSKGIFVERFCSTKEAAQYIGFQPQTLRKWAMDGSGPIQPVKVGNRLRWNMKDLKALMGIEQ